MAETTARDRVDRVPASTQKEGPTLHSLAIRYVVERERDKSFTPPAVAPPTTAWATSCGWSATAQRDA